MNLLDPELQTEKRFVRARSPLRVSFVGGGTDLASYYTEHGGAVLASTINRYVWVTLIPKKDNYISISSLDFDATVKYHVDEEPVYEEALKLAQAAVNRLVNRGTNHPGLELYIQSDAPAGSGLGGSAALTLAVLGAIIKMENSPLETREMARLAYIIENQDLGIIGGIQDQYQIASGGFHFLEFTSKGIAMTPLRVPKLILNDLEHHLLLCYTGKTRVSAKIMDNLDKYIKARRPATILGLRELRRLAYEMKDALLDGRLRDMALMLDMAWKLKVELNPPEVTDASIDQMYEVAKENGALGGKLLGAGGGGYLLLFCESTKKKQVRQRLEGLGAQFAPFSFVDQGLETWWTREL